MQDRIATYPNRWVLTPVTGQANTYDLTRADEPITVGTQLNKATLLPDAVASAIESATGASNVELPADALNALATGLTNLGSDTICHIETGSYTGTGTSGASNPNTLTFNFKPRFVIINNGNPQYSNWYGNSIAFYLYNRGGTYTISSGTSDSYTLYINVADKTLSWYYASTSGSASTKAQFQKNISGTTYYYICFGVD